MTGIGDTQRGIGRPRLTADQIDMMIRNLTDAIHNGQLSGDDDLAMRTVAELIGFYTRRWGLPPSISSSTAVYERPGTDTDQSN